MRRVFITHVFNRWMRKIGVTNHDLLRAVDEMARGLIDADLGGNIVKKRLALPGRGKRGGARTIVATRKAGIWFFLIGFAKNEKSTIDAAELKALQELAWQYLQLDKRELEQAVEDGIFTEIEHEQHEA
jgi:hypothetical protein